MQKKKKKKTKKKYQKKEPQKKNTSKKYQKIQRAEGDGSKAAPIKAHQMKDMLVRSNKMGTKDHAASVDAKK
jgi:hypothetical protein